MALDRPELLLLLVQSVLRRAGKAFRFANSQVTAKEKKKRERRNSFTPLQLHHQRGMHTPAVRAQPVQTGLQAGGRGHVYCHEERLCWVRKRKKRKSLEKAAGIPHASCVLAAEWQHSVQLFMLIQSHGCGQITALSVKHFLSRVAQPLEHRNKTNKMGLTRTEGK